MAVYRFVNRLCVFNCSQLLSKADINYKNSSIMKMYFILCQYIYYQYSTAWCLLFQPHFLLQVSLKRFRLVINFDCHICIFFTHVHLEKAMLIMLLINKVYATDTKMKSSKIKVINCQLILYQADDQALPIYSFP